MLKNWERTTQQVKLTYLMADITLVLQELQKVLQTAALILPDVLTARDSALRKLSLIQSGPLPGGQEERLLNINSSTQMNLMDEEKESDQMSELRSGKCNVSNQYVTTGRRQWLAVREKVVASFMNFLNVRLNLENDNTISMMIALLKANTITDMINSGRPLVQSLFGEEAVVEFSSSVCDNWPMITEVQNLEITDSGTEYSYRLRNLAVRCTGLLQKLLCAILAISPHSMTTERVISHHNQIKSIHRMSARSGICGIRISQSRRAW